VRLVVKQKRAPGRPPSKVGEERVYTNGYTYIRTQQGWRLKHHVLAEQALGRALRTNERVLFQDGDRTNLSSDNIGVHPKADFKERRCDLIVKQIARLEKELIELSDDEVT
jgi:hypothetical protein